MMPNNNNNEKKNIQFASAVKSLNRHSTNSKTTEALLRKKKATETTFLLELYSGFHFTDFQKIE